MAEGTMVTRRMVLCVLALTLLSAACSSGDDDDDSSAAGGQSAAADDGRTDDERQADEQTAAATLLVLDDFPPGWEAEPADTEEDESDDELKDGLADCLDVDRSLLDDVNPQAKSPTFRSPDDAEVSA